MYKFCLRSTELAQLVRKPPSPQTSRTAKQETTFESKNGLQRAGIALVSAH